MESAQQTQNYFSISVSQSLNALKLRLRKPSVLSTNKQKNDTFLSPQQQQKQLRSLQYQYLTKQRSNIQNKINSIRQPQISLCRSRAEVVQNKIRNLISKHSDAILPPISNISRILDNPNNQDSQRLNYIKTEIEQYPKRSLTLNNQKKSSSIELLNKNVHKDNIRSYVKRNKKKVYYNPEQVHKKLSLNQENIGLQLGNFKNKRSISQMKKHSRSNNVSLRSLIKSNKTQKSHKANYTQQFNWFALRTQYTQSLISLTQIYTNNQNEQTLADNDNKIPKIPLKENIKQFLKRYQPKNQEVTIKTITKSPFCAVQYGKNQLYIGEMIGKKKSGMGILITQNKCFEGFWKSNEIIRGIEINEEGVFKGLYVNDLREGRGEFQWHTGQIYVGEWKKGMKDGEGLWINPRGDNYNGKWKNGRVEGIGVFTVKGRSDSKKDRKYKGSFLNFKQHGFGRQYFQNGDYFQGIYREDRPNGQGVYRWKNGAIYEGQFLSGKCDGLGVLKTPFNLVYKGQFIQDKPEGECQILLQNGDIYYGMVKDGRKNGKGTLKLKKSNQMLNGYWKDDYFVNEKEQLQQ